jgi:hypothetical protein
VSRRPTSSEWAFTKELKATIELSATFGAADFKHKFLAAWNDACFDMLVRTRKELKIGAMTTTSCERYLEMYKRHLITNVAYEHLAVDDTNYMKRMHAPVRTTHRAAVAPTQPTEGSKCVHLPAVRSQATEKPATTTEKGAATIATSDLKRLCPKIVQICVFWQRALWYYRPPRARVGERWCSGGVQCALRSVGAQLLAAIRSNDVVPRGTGRHNDADTGCRSGA